MIAHGSSGRLAVRNAILLAARGVEGGVVGLVEEGLGRGAMTTDLQDGAQQHTVPTVADPENGESQR